MIIGILLITVILIVALVLAKVFRDSDSQVISQNSGTSSSLSDIVTVTTEAVTATKEYDSVMINVVGMDYKAKKADLAEWIELNCIAEEYSDEYPVGQIIWQSVKEGEDFKSGDTLDVKVSLGPSKVKVPEFKGVTLSAYIAEIEKIGIKNHTSTPAVNYNYATGAVIKTSVEPGETIDLTTDYKFVITYADNPAVTTTAPPRQREPPLHRRLRPSPHNPAAIREMGDRICPALKRRIDSEQNHSKSADRRIGALFASEQGNEKDHKDHSRRHPSEDPPEDTGKAYRVGAV